MDSETQFLLAKFRAIREAFDDKTLSADQFAGIVEDILTDVEMVFSEPII